MDPIEWRRTLPKNYWRIIALQVWTERYEQRRAKKTAARKAKRMRRMA